MLIALPLAVAMVAGLAWRHADGPGGKRLVLGIAALALGIRLAAVLVISQIAFQTHGTGVWLSDEASFFLATEALLPDPVDRTLPQGLDHLAGDGYLGLTTVLAMAGGVADANTFRVINASLGTLVVVLGMLVARRLFGARAAVTTGLVLAVWPTLVLWSATMLRDTLGSLAVVAVWWTLGREREQGWIRIIATVFLSTVIVLSLRPYLGAALLAGVCAWAAYPFVRRARARTLGLLAAGLAIAVLGVGASQARRIDFAAHELFYRQTVTHIELLGRLYSDEPRAGGDWPIKPGTVIGVTDPASGWVIGGVVEDLVGPDVVRVALTDESYRDVSVRDIVPLESADIPPAQFIAWVVPGVASYLTGTSITSEPSSPSWIGLAIAWDALLVLAIVGVLVARLTPREWLYPLCITAGTVLALVAIPGAPGNADRHRATQTVPLLLVFASGLVSARGLARTSGFAVTSIRTSHPSEAAPANSRMRSA